MSLKRLSSKEAVASSMSSDLPAFEAAKRPSSFFWALRPRSRALLPVVVAIVVEVVVELPPPPGPAGYTPPPVAADCITAHIPITREFRGFAYLFYSFYFFFLLVLPHSPQTPARLTYTPQAEQTTLLEAP
jgi:hypothetical protein